ncbi:MAG: hypothetical protein V4735_08580 [Pseudomonadota bacterium]
MIKHYRTLVGAGFGVLWQEARGLLKPSWISAALLLVFLILFAPHITRHTADAPLLASFYDDEPLITMQLDGMTAAPYGNPANYLSGSLGKRPAPAHWLNIEYYNIPYYGGLYLDMALAVWAPMKLAGAPLFPTAPIILRVLTMLFACCTLLAVCTLIRRALGMWAEVGAGVFLITSQSTFLSLAYMLHPDMLLFFLSLLAVATAARHLRDKDIASMIALGLVAGLAHGAKMGGPHLVPLTALVVALAMGGLPALKAAPRAWIKRYLMHGVLLAVIAVVMFVVTTPYAVFDRYYLLTWRIWGKAFTSDSPITITNFWDWCIGFERSIRWPLLFVAAGVVALRIKRRHQYVPHLFLCLGVFSLTLFFFYAVLSKYWVQMQYMVVPLALLAGLAAHALDMAVAAVGPKRRRQAMVAACMVVLALAIGWGKPLAKDMVMTSIALGEWRQAPQVVLGEWAREHLPKGASVVWDTQAYFPAKEFPDQRMNGGPLKYRDFKRVMPDYFVLNLYSPHMWMMVKMQEKPVARWEEHYASMRLYQDLLGTDPRHPTIQPAAVPGVTFVMSSGGYGNIGGDDCHALPPFKARMMKLFALPCDPNDPLNSRTLFLFKVDKKKLGAYIKQLEKEAAH